MSNPIWPAPSQPHYQGMNGHEHMIWTRLLDRVDASMIQLDRIEQRLIAGDERFEDLDRRMNVLETKKQAKGAAVRAVLAFVNEVATPKQIMGGLILVYMALQGILAPAEIKDLLLRLVGLSPSS